MIAAATACILASSACSSDTADDEAGPASNTASSTPVDESLVDPTDPATWLRSVVFERGDEGIDTYRIPGAVLSGAGTVLVFAEARSLSPLDHDPRRLVLRRSTDGGATWSANIAVLDEDTEPECDHTDPVPVALGSGEVIVLFRSCGRLGSARSDDAMTWTDHEELTISEPGEVPAEVLETMRAGPGHGIELRHGNSAGRLVVSGDVEVEGATWTVLLLSDDEGATWQVGAHHRSENAAGVDPDETAVAELSDGTVVLSARNGSAVEPGRVQATSSDGGETFDIAADGSTLSVAEDLTGPVVEGALLAEPTTGVAVYSSPSDPGYRRGLRLWTSEDGSQWVAGPLISSQPAAYSDLVALPPSGYPAIGLIVETGDRGLYERIDLVRVPTSALGQRIGELSTDFDPSTAVSGRLVVEGESFEVVDYCLGENRAELDGGWIEVDLGDESTVSARVGLDDRGDGRPLELEGTGPLDLRAGITFRSELTDPEGTAHQVDLVIVNFELCAGA